VILGYAKTFFRDEKSTQQFFQQKLVIVKTIFFWHSYEKNNIKALTIVRVKATLELRHSNPINL